VAVDAELGQPHALLTTAPSPFKAVSATPMPMSLNTDQASVVTISFTPTTVGDIRGTLMVTDDADDQPVAVATLHGIAVDAQALVEPTQLDFGKIEVGTQALQALTVVNASPLPVQVTPTPFGTDSDEFSSRPMTVPPHESRQLPVTFAPTRIAKVSAGMWVTTCQGCSAVAVNLYGEGLDSAL